MSWVLVKVQLEISIFKNLEQCIRQTYIFDIGLPDTLNRFILLKIPTKYRF